MRKPRVTASQREGDRKGVSPLNQFIIIIGYNIVWLATVYGAKWQLFWLGPAVSILYILATKKEIPMWNMGVYASIGMAVETIHQQLHFIDYGGHIAPLWILPLWICFGLMVQKSFAPLAKHPILLGLLSAIGGPMTYYSAGNLGEFPLSDNPVIWLIVATLWGIGMSFWVRRGVSRQAPKEPQ